MFYLIFDTLWMLLVMLKLDFLCIFEAFWLTLINFIMAKLSLLLLFNFFSVCCFFLNYLIKSNPTYFYKLEHFSFKENKYNNKRNQNSLQLKQLYALFSPT